MKVGKICNRQVSTIREATSIVDAAKQMREEHVGDLVVVAVESGHLVPRGVLTDRDIVVGVVAKGLEHLGSLEVGDVLVGDVVTATENEDLSLVLDRMKHFGIRRIPIVTATGALVGILSLTDLLGLLSEDVSTMAALLAEQPKREKERRA